MRNFLLLLLTSIILGGCGKITPEPQYVWSAPGDSGRAEYVMFRNVFEAPENATCKLHLFADSRYHLLVNGEFVNFGPARFYPENPQYDTYDITSLLRKGANVVAVKALSNGTYTYQVPLSEAGFIAWGEVLDDSKVVHSFSTPGNWVCREMQGFDRLAPKMSFATGVMEVFDARRDPDDWAEVGFDDEDWKEVSVKADQEHWGELTPRTIPHLTQDKRPVKKLLGAWSLKTDEDIYSFRVKSADRTRGDFGKNKYAFAYTYIWSPENQQVRTGLWWGEYWLNGEGPLENLGLEPGRPVRSDVILDLKQGWNFFFVKYGIVWANWEFYMAIPKSAGLELSPEKQKSGDLRFMTAGPFTDDEEKLVKNLELPFSSPGDLPDLSAGWVPKTDDDKAGNPAWDVAWSYFDHPVDPAGKNGSMQFEGGEPVALVYDIGGKTLGRFYLDIEAEAGTEIDIAFAEDLQDGRPWILKRAGLYTAVKFIADEGENHLESFKPYGARYIQVNLTGYDDQVKLNETGMISQTYPFEQVGDFECSDTLLNAIWDLGWRTLLVCSEDSYTDTPFRERGLYAGDALPEYAITLAGSGDSRLMKQCTHLYSQMYNDLMQPGSERQYTSVNHMADYPLLTLLSWVWSVNRTGDLAYAEKYYDGYRNMMELVAENRMQNGLLDHSRAFIEWTRIDKDATLTALQSLAAYCFRSMAYVSDMLGKGDASWLLEEEKKTLDAMHQLCWDGEKGAFRDGFRDGVPIDHHYPISSIWPSLFNQTTREQEAKLEGFYDETLRDIGTENRNRLSTPYGGFYVIDALYRKGYAATAEYYMKQYWGPMIRKHNDTAWENFGDGSDGGGQGTLSHAWSGGPTYHMTRHILGADLGWPDYTSPDTLHFEPQTNSVTWAKGVVPHSMGTITVDWRTEGDKLYFNCEVPDGIAWDVQPRGMLADKELYINNEKVTN